MTGANPIQVGLTLEPLSGPMTEPVRVNEAGVLMIGRQADCDVRLLADESVSRRHARLMWRGGRWFIEDMGSRHGTLLNASAVPAGSPAPLANGDFVQLGSSTFRVRHGSATGSGMIGTTIAGEMAPAVVRTVDDAEFEGADRVRLDLFVECAAAIGGGGDDEAWGEALLQAAIKGTGYARAAIVQWPPGSRMVEVRHFRAISPLESPQDLACSISLIAEAAKGQTVRLEDSAVSAGGESIQRLRIESALCAPVRVGDAVTEYLYLDARAGESPPSQGAGGFCDGLAKLWGIGQTVLRQRERERHEREMRRDLDAAREVQQMIMPDDAGQVANVRYAMHMEPGRIVAGDMFDIFEMPDGRSAFLLGDVESKGVGAAMVMAVAQTHLRSTLLRTGDPGEAIRSLCRRLPERSYGGRTITIWVGVHDRRTQQLTYCVAGHGYWLHGSGDHDAEQVEFEGGPPIGTDRDYPYPSERLTVQSGDRIVVYSDGIAEQPGRAGEGMFGLRRVAESIRGVREPDDMVRAILQAVAEFGGTTRLADDATVACMAFS